MLNSFWDDKNRKPNKFERPKKSEVKERKANIRITQANREIGRATVVKKRHEKSEYWKERHSKKNSRGHWVEKKVGDKSTMGLQRENFVTEESDELDLEILKDALDEQEKKITHLITRLNTQEEEFENYKKNTQEVLNLITEALKVKVEKQEVSVEKSTEDSPIHRRTYFQPDPILREITLNFLHEIVYPFGKRIVNNYKKGEECSFSFKMGKDECYAYGHFSTDEKGYLTVEIDEFTKESGKDINKKDIRFPIALHHIEESGSSESSSSDSENEVEVETKALDSIKEPAVVETGLVEVVEEKEVIQKDEEDEEEVIQEVIEEDEVVEEEDEVIEEDEENQEEIIEEDEVIEENQEEEVIKENELVETEAVEEEEELIQEEDEAVEEEEEVQEEELVQEGEVIEDEKVVEESEAEPETKNEEPKIIKETIKLVLQPISKSDSETTSEYKEDTSESKESPVLELPRLKLPRFNIPEFKKL